MALILASAAAGFTFTIIWSAHFFIKELRGGSFGRRSCLKVFSSALFTMKGADLVRSQIWYTYIVACASRHFMLTLMPETQMGFKLTFSAAPSSYLLMQKYCSRIARQCSDKRRKRHETPIAVEIDYYQITGFTLEKCQRCCVVERLGICSYGIYGNDAAADALNHCR